MNSQNFKDAISTIMFKCIKATVLETAENRKDDGKKKEHKKRKNAKKIKK
jgi:hypothetical protein